MFQINKLRVLGATLAVLAMPLLPTAAYADLPPIMPTSDIERGMVGEAFTVVDDSGLQSFRVDVVGLMDSGKGSQPMIMATASGELIDKVGGVLQGMSGSPVYIDGRLVGAVSAGIKEMETSTFFITPIEDMLALWELPDTKNKIISRALDIKKLQEENRAWREKFFKKDKDKAGKEKAASEENTAAKTDDQKEDVTAAENTNGDKDTPSESKPNEENASATADKDGEQATAEVIFVDEPKKDEPKKDVVEPKTVVSPRSGWYFSGFTASGMDFAERSLLPLEEETVQTVITNRGTDYNAQLEPGSPMGIALVYGDFSVGATGTVTAVDNKRILGLGHQFLHKGNVSYFLTDASVIGTISGPTAGIKLATIGNIIGRISQDRAAGVAGELGVFPAVVPVKVKVTDNTLNREDSYGVRIAYDESFLAQLASSVAYAAMSKTTDSLDGSTATLGFTVRTDAAENGAISRENMFYNATDVGQVSVLELLQVLNIICANTDKESDIVDVQVDVKLERGRKTASLISAVPDKVKVRPGDTVNFTTVIKPYRKEKETFVIPYTVPKTQPSGNLTLDIRGGGLVPLTQIAALQQVGIDLSPQEDKTVPVSTKLKNFVETGKNNEIIIAPGQVPQSPTNQKKALKAAQRAAREAAEAAKNAKADKKIKLLADKKQADKSTRFAVPYIIDNVIHSALQVER